MSSLLLKKDLLSNLGATIYLNQEKIEVLIPKDKGICFMALLHQVLKDQRTIPTEILTTLVQRFGHKEKSEGQCIDNLLKYYTNSRQLPSSLEMSTSPEV